MDNLISSFHKSNKAFTRNPLGIIALFILLVYAMASLVFSFSELDYYLQIAFSVFLIGFPILVLCIFNNLVINHNDKLYSPGDWPDQKIYFEILKLRFQKADNIRDISSKRIEEFKETDEVRKAIVERILVSSDSLYLKILYHSLENNVSFKTDYSVNNIKIFIKKKEIGGSLLEYFHQKMLDLHSQNIITIKSLESMEFTVTDYAKDVIIELYKKYVKENEQ